MWVSISTIIIRYRIAFLLAVLGVTIFMGYHAKNVKLSYSVARVVPDDDPDYQAYIEFQETFGQDGTIMVLGVENKDFFKVDFFNKWRILSQRLGAVQGVEQIVSIFSAQRLVKAKGEKKFIPESLFKDEINSQSQLDSLVEIYKLMPFYSGSLYNFETNTSFIAINIDDETLGSIKRMVLLEEVFALADEYLEPYGLEAKYSGLPYIRTSVANSVKAEMKLFSILSLIICAVILLLFFRSITSVIFPMSVIVIIVVWALGTVVLFDYRLNAVTSLIPPLIIIIGVPNFIYLVNKYHNEFKKHGNKMRAIHRMVQKIGIVTLLTNATTAVGFLVLAFTNSPVLKEFGLVAGINILATFVVSIIVIPVFFSYLPEPSSKHTNYLDREWMNTILNWIDRVVRNHRPAVFVFTLIVIAASGYGLTKLEAVGFVLEDIPREQKVFKDLTFFEDNFGGVLPFEVVVDSKSPKGLNDLDVMRQISQFQDSLAIMDALSRSYSIADMLKLSRQALYNNNPSRYGIPSGREQNALSPYLRSTDNTDKLLNNLVDSNQQVARITSNIADIGSVETTKLLERLNKIADEVFEEDLEIKFTGISLLFVKNNKYLIRSLINSLIMAFFVISILMGLLFKKLRMILVSLIPNFIPLLATAGIMGFTGIPLKPSTVLVFSIAFGISIDDALHFLAKYRQELLQHNWDIQKTISVALYETGRSMFYTSIVLFSGFSIFTLSDFGGTSALGFLTSITLLIAMVTNLILLPSLILSFFPKRSLLK